MSCFWKHVFFLWVGRSDFFFQNTSKHFFSVTNSSSRWYLSEREKIFHFQIMLCEMLLITIIRGNVCSFLAKLFSSDSRHEFPSSLIDFNKTYVPYTGERCRQFTQAIGQHASLRFAPWSTRSLIFRTLIYHSQLPIHTVSQLGHFPTL